MGQGTPKIRAKFVASIPLGRLSRPLDVSVRQARLEAREDG